ncbi:hypothetical protein FOA52_009421, partial [Chlamydomonas sp. UWO 241]
GIEDSDIKDAWARLGGRPDSIEKMCEEVAITNDLSAPPTQRALRRRLLVLGLIRKMGGGGGKKKPKAPRPKVDASLLRSLFEEFRGQPDALNQITAKLPGGPWTAAQVQRLLSKLGTDGGGVKRKARVAADREELAALYLKYKGHPDQFEKIAEEMTGVGDAKQVKRLLNKLGLTESTKRRRTGKEDDGGSKGAKAGRGGSGPPEGIARARAVPEPDAQRAVVQLGELQVAFVASDGRWMGAREAAAWVLGKLEAADALWADSR